MTFVLFAVALFSAAFALNSLLRLFTVAFSGKNWVSTWGPFLNCIYIAMFGSLALFLFLKTIPVIFG